MPEKSYQITFKLNSKYSREAKIITWLESLESQGVVRSARIKGALIEHIEGVDQLGKMAGQLDRIEEMMEGGVQIAIPQAPEDDFDDMILDGDL